MEMKLNVILPKVKSPSKFKKWRLMKFNGMKLKWDLIPERSDQNFTGQKSKLEVKWIDLIWWVNAGLPFVTFRIGGMKTWLVGEA